MCSTHREPSELALNEGKRISPEEAYTAAGVYAVYVNKAEQPPLPLSLKSEESSFPVICT